MLAVDAARRWKDTWTRSWPAADVDAIAALYAPSATYRALAFRGPRQGTDDIRGYLRENFNAESGVRCRFGEPIVAGSGAAIEWWASWVEDGSELTMAGVTLLQFDSEGHVIDHRDYWNQEQNRHEPYVDW